MRRQTVNKTLNVRSFQFVVKRSLVMNLMQIDREVTERIWIAAISA
jgi:hypothetical protein